MKEVLWLACLFGVGYLALKTFHVVSGLVSLALTVGLLGFFAYGAYEMIVGE